MKKGDLKKFWDKFWFLLWKDNSWKGWVFSIAFLFVFVKLILFPILSLLTGSALPLAIVESCSMYHQGDIFSNYENWWQNHESKYDAIGITPEQFEDFSFKKGFNKGDIFLITRAKPEKIKIGDVLVFEAGNKNPLIHRVIDIKMQDGGYIFSTIGDNNPRQLNNEKTITENQLIGKATFKIAPFIGWGKLIFFENTRPSQEKGFCKEN